MHRLKSFSFLCAAIFLAILLLASKAAFAGEKNSFTDSRDGKTYKTVRIGSQTWMAENLNYDIEGSACYDNDDSNCDKYGRLYAWAKHNGICPSGFHIPTDAEWEALWRYTGSLGSSGTKLKAADDWTYCSGLPSGTDNFGFAALPGGFGISNGNFYSAGFRGIWWSSTENSSAFAYGWGLHFHEKSYRDVFIKSSLFSIRCIKN